MDAELESAGPVHWDAVVLSCAKKTWTEALQRELEVHQAKGYINEDAVVLVVEDPKTSVGSGGATINALLTVVEYMSARRGFCVINPDVLIGTNILILHTGRSYSYEPCTRPFVTLPICRDEAKFEGPVCNFDLTYALITEKIAVGVQPGVWVCSLDMVLSIPEFLDTKSSFESCDVCVISIPQAPKLLKDHGVYQVNPQGFIENIFFQADQDTMKLCMREDGLVPAAIGMVYLSQTVSERLLTFHAKPPLDACTYFGVDSGQPPLKLSLFFDVLLPMTTAVTEEDFVRGNRGSSFGKPATLQPQNSRFDMEVARQMLWRYLHGFKMTSYIIEGGKYNYMTCNAMEHKKLILNCPETPGLRLTWSSNVHSVIEPTCQVSEDSTTLFSILKGEVMVGGRSAISYCELDGNVKVGKDSLLSGLCLKGIRKTIKLPEGIVIQGFHIRLATLGMMHYIVTAHGKFDDIMAPTWKSMSSFCNQPWLVVMDQTGILKEELWGSDVDPNNQSIYTAKLFPVFHASDPITMKETLWLMGAVEDDEEKSILKRWRESWRLSLSDILEFVDLESEFARKRELFYDIGKIDLKQTLETGGNKGFCNLFSSASVDGYTEPIFQTLDKVISETNSPGIAARTLANIADVLGAQAGVKGGLRSGPAGNVSWKKAFQFLEAKDFSSGVAALAKERKKWMGRPDILIRAARHYEGAAQILIRQAVMTAKKFFTFKNGSLPLMNKWIQADCPARIDLSGGWSDTPPITYENGGAVIMTAVLINGKRPIGARAKRIKDPLIRLKLLWEGGNTALECRTLQDMEDYCQPHASGSLLKAAFVCVDLVDLNSSESLAQQLLDNYGGGFEMESWSNLPQGSGMGTSSILAGAVLAALLTAAGKTYDKEGLIHAVLYLEQLLTTGGGWQDQVGGLVGGVQLGLSENKLPLQVRVSDLNICERYITQFNERLLLIYSGKTRLARNLLLDVVRNWYSRNPNIVDTEDKLVVLAHKCSRAFQDGDFEQVGLCVAEYWQLKKRLAPGCEPATITHIMSVCKPYVYGMCSCGAGGGGFIYGIMKEPNCQEFIKTILDQQEGLEAVVYHAQVDGDGLTVSTED